MVEKFNIHWSSNFGSQPYIEIYLQPQTNGVARSISEHPNGSKVAVCDCVLQHPSFPLLKVRKIKAMETCCSLNGHILKYIFPICLLPKAPKRLGGRHKATNLLEKISSSSPSNSSKSHRVAYCGSCTQFTH